MRRQHGFSLIELVMFIVVTGIAVGAIGLAFQRNVSHSADPLLRQKAVALAQFYSDEILRKKWNEATPTGGGCVNTGSPSCPAGPAAVAIGNDGDSRSLFDDIDDYHGLGGAPTDQGGNLLANFAGYTVGVTVAQPAAAWNGVDARDVRVITVTVNTPTSEALQTTAYRVNF